MRGLTSIFLFIFSITCLNAQVLNAIGDSYVNKEGISSEQSWFYKLAQKYGFTYKNCGHSGACIAFDRTHDERRDFGPGLWQRYTELDSDADYVIINAGHNDAEKCGENKDSLRMFADSLEFMISGIECLCPNAKIGFVTPWYVDIPGFKPVCKTIRKVCRRHNIPVLYNYSSKSPIKVRDVEFRRKYFLGPDDPAHLNVEGHALFFSIAESWFLKEMRK